MICVWSWREVGKHALEPNMLEVLKVQSIHAEQFKGLADDGGAGGRMCRKEEAAEGSCMDGWRARG